MTLGNPPPPKKKKKKKEREKLFLFEASYVITLFFYVIMYIICMKLLGRKVSTLTSPKRLKTGQFLHLDSQEFKLW